MAKPTTTLNRRRERGSISPDGIITGAFELAEQLGIDKMSMPVLAKHLGGRAEPVGDDFAGSTIAFKVGRDLIPGLDGSHPNINGDAP